MVFQKPAKYCFQRPTTNGRAGSGSRSLDSPLTHLRVPTKPTFSNWKAGSEASRKRDYQIAVSSTMTRMSISTSLKALTICLRLLETSAFRTLISVTGSTSEVPARNLAMIDRILSSTCFLADGVFVEKISRAGPFTRIAVTISSKKRLPSGPTVGTITVQSFSL